MQDKHLSYRFDLAKQMVDTSKELGFPFLAGSSIPCGWRMPALDMPHGAKVVEALAYAASLHPALVGRKQPEVWKVRKRLHVM